MTPAAPRLIAYPGRGTDAAPVLISVVTTVRDGAKSLPRTIGSIRSQRIPELEYIVVDAGSTDGTLDILRASGDVVTYWQSEPDRGISDGFNKGIALSKGEFVALVNADDWLSPGQLSTAISTAQKTGADFVFGDLLYHGEKDEPLYRVMGDANYASRISHVMPALNHPTVIVRRSAYEKHGLFRLDFRYAMDYELLLRFHCAGCVGVYDPRVVGHMSLAGVSDTSSLKAVREVRDASIIHGYPRMPAHILYGLRVLKDRSRRLAEQLLPASMSVALRGAFNRNLVRAK